MLNFKDNGYPYLVVVTNFSQIWAMYCLVLFYKHYKTELKDIKPLAKFICIKAVVFFTFWQGVILAILVKADVITATETYTVDQSSAGLQSFMICIEMFIASIAHVYAFPSKEFNDINKVHPEYNGIKDYILTILWPNDTNDEQYVF